MSGRRRWKSSAAAAAIASSSRHDSRPTPTPLKRNPSGVQYGAGTDSGPPGRFAGYFLHLELAEMVKAGLTPLQAITAATSHNAEFLHAKDLGTLEAGKQGDFVVLNADPTKNIENTHRISAVYISGRSVPTIWSMCAGRPTNACKGGPDQP